MEKSENLIDTEVSEALPETDEAYPVQVAAEFQSHDVRSITFNCVSWLILDAIVTVAIFTGGVINFFVNDEMGWVNWAILCAGICVVLLLLFMAFRWPRWEYDRASWRLDDVGLQIRRGVVWRSQISIPIARVQHADVSQGPLQRRFGLGKLTIHTAGTQNASVVIEGLAHETALELRDKLVAQRKSGYVV